MSNRTALLLILACMLPSGLSAMPWEFGDAITISGEQAAGVFHHLDSAGRRSIASSGTHVGVVWEDNRDGRPRCYAALKPMNSGRFDRETLVSGDGDAFEPAIVGLGDDRFLVAWEEDGRVWARVLTPRDAGPAAQISGPGGAHPSLAFQPLAQAYAVWSQRRGEYSRITLARLTIEKGRLEVVVTADHVIDKGESPGRQLYPTLVVLNDGRLGAAWEDRRHGHTVIMYSHSEDGREFGRPTQINESFWGGREQGFGRGTGAMRVALAVHDHGEVVAIWADKRNFRSGYDVYSALSSGGGTHFGPNVAVQDGFGSEVGQWHPAIASDGHSRLAVAWDDDRDGTPDVWLSWYRDNTWSDDEPIPPASGPGVQVAPSIAIDEWGNLHAVWLDKPDLNSSSRIRYVMGVPNEGD